MLSHYIKKTEIDKRIFSLKKKKSEMEDQSERENSPQTYDTEGGGSSRTEASITSIERLREILERRESTIEDLRQTVAMLKHNIAEQRDEIIRLKSLNNTHNLVSFSVFYLLVFLS